MSWTSRDPEWGEPADESADCALGSLTARERQVAEAVAAGASNREVASALAMALRTVECHLADIYTKFGVDSRVQLAVVLANRAADTLGAEWLSLTEAEKDLAALVGAGMSNRLAASQLYLYLSPKTVEFHLGRIYRKPGVTSRCQLPRPAPQAANTGRELRPAVRELRSGIT
jgi:DNA-binding CsgD family transcriptional regulator